MLGRRLSRPIPLILAVLLLLTVSPAVRAADPQLADPENTLWLDLDAGRVVIRMRPDLAPNHVARIKHLVRGGFYDGLPFHRVIDGFMAQTGDPGGPGPKGSGGTGRTLKAEFTNTPQMRGAVSMARGSSKNGADSQWFIVLTDANRKALDGKYTLWGQVTDGMEFVDLIRKGDTARDGVVQTPDRIVRLQVAADADGAGIPADTTAPASMAAKDFSAGEFRCLAFDRPGARDQSAVAPVWAHGYLSGAYQAQGKLTLTARDDTLTPLVRAACAAAPQTLLLAIAKDGLAKTPRALPDTLPAFAPMAFTCRMYAGADKAVTDVADLWALAFIQGYKTVGQPDVEISYESRAVLLKAIAGACAKSPGIGFATLMSAVAAKVKIK